MKISCPHCGQHFDVDAADVGKEADCINCGKRFTLQSTVAPAVPAQQPPPSSETGEMLDSEAFDETDPETGAALQGNHAEIDKIVRRYLRPGDDETVRRALEVVILDRKASTSYLQRRLGIGYNRAAEIMDLMEERGIVGPPSGSGNKREILVPYPQENLPSSVCPFCGGELVPGVKKCRHCGEWIERSARPLSPVVYVILSLFLGGVGVHNFVAKQLYSGIEKILLLLTAWRIIYVWPHHSLGYMVLVGLGVLILTDIVMFCREIQSPLSTTARKITVVLTAVFLLAFYIYGISYQGEVGAVEASYAISCYDPANCSEQEASLRMTRLMNWPLADSVEIRKAVHKGIKDGMEMKRHMDARLHREKSSAPPVRF